MSGPGGVVLICMPFGQVFTPSIGLSLLKAELAAEGISAQVRYFSIRFAELIGQAFYCGLASRDTPPMQDLAGEWMFSRALFGSNGRSEAYVDEILRNRSDGDSGTAGAGESAALIRHVLRARDQVDGFLRWCLGEIVADGPRLVGFTSLFQQHVASLALARMIKEALPETFIVFGGANCEGVMGAETVRQFSFVDAAVSGEADLVFPELARRALAGQPVAGLPGVRTRDGVHAEFAAGRFSTAPWVRDLDALPYPDYEDYFRQFKASRFDRKWQPSIYLETGRGCWWGEKMHCTFCGLNDETMAFRSKSGRRALDELSFLVERWPACPVDVTDNILDMRYFKDFVPALAARPTKAALYYEVKANLHKGQVRMLRDAGIRSIQPGIESFSDPVLKLMRKGVSALQNIQLLKWCKELGVKPGWNMIWGFPGEPPEEYDRMAKLVPLLTHLPPPDSYGPLRLDRFSPNFEDSERLGFTDVTPLPAYPHVYPLPGEAVANLACFFSYDYQEPRDVESYVARLEKELRAWQRPSGCHELFSVDTGERLLIWDLRAVGRIPVTVLDGADRVLYQRCDAACDVRRLEETLARSPWGRLPAGAITERLAPLLDRGLLITDGLRYLALAIPLGEYSPPAPAVERFYQLVRAVGARAPAGWVVRAGSDSPMTRRIPRVARARARARRMKSGRYEGQLRVDQFAINDQGDVLIEGLGSRRACKGETDAYR